VTKKLPGAHQYVNVYFPASMLVEIQAECRRTGRSLNWLMRRAWLMARHEIQALKTQQPMRSQ